jgi:hypothetical protein
MVFVGASVYANDTAIIAPMPMPLAMCDILGVRYTDKFSIKFSAKKTICFYFSNATFSHPNDSKQLPLFTTAGKYIEYVDS